ncbi:hypothetical protein [Cellulosilyticum ruminicola]|uniref:hypothetical protein n=1 Tax=Cellulosilyticum ruminicola TaxID=425254 RepID=UPI0006D1EBAB|nr:hypothetical protein [Cellulosilyticum ruminicola]
MSHIIAITASYKTLLKAGLNKEEACKNIRKLQALLGRIARFIYNTCDLLPWGYQLVRKSLMNDMTGQLGRNFKAEFP